MTEDVGVLVANALAARRGDGPPVTPESLQALMEAARRLTEDDDETARRAAGELAAGRAQAAMNLLRVRAAGLAHPGSAWRDLARLAFTVDPLLALEAFLQARAGPATNPWDDLLTARLYAWDTRASEAEEILLSIIARSADVTLMSLARGDLVALRSDANAASEAFTKWALGKPTT